MRPDDAPEDRQGLRRPAQSRSVCEVPVTVRTDEHQPRPGHRSFRLTREGERIAVARQVRPAVVLPDREARALLAAAEREDVAAGGCFSAGPAGVQVWSGPWDGRLGSRGTSEHHGSVDWSYDTPSRHWITVYRVLVTAKGEAAGATPQSVLSRVLALADVQTPMDCLGLLDPPARDPFWNDPARPVS